MLEPKSEVFMQDCIEGMKQYPDKWFDLACTDPPYGIDFSSYERGSGGEKLKERYTKTGKKKWDNIIPSDEYFKELIRVSKNQIIWGGNYFPFLWKEPCKHFIFWYKKNPVPNFSDGELAWSSFKDPASCFNYMYYGNINSEKDRIHPTQKPVKLYDWIFSKYAKPNDKILDSHLGSGSSRIAAYKAKLDFTAFEIDADYFAAQDKRFNQFKQQLTLF